MKLLLRVTKSFVKNIIIKRKFKAYAQSFYDKEYRAQINRLYELTKGSSGTLRWRIPVDTLKHGHKIIYPEYEQLLVNNDRIPIDPIKVVQLDDGTHLVVDGNHRLSAVIKRAKDKGEQFTECEVIVFA